MIIVKRLLQDIVTSSYTCILVIKSSLIQEAGTYNLK